MIMDSAVNKAEIEVPSKKKENMDTQPNDPIKEKIYWIQMGITLFFGITSYYLLVIGWPFIEISLPLITLFGDIVVVFSLYFIIILVVPSIILLVKFRQTVKDSIKGSLKTLATPLLLYFFLLGFILYLTI